MFFFFTFQDALKKFLPVEMVLFSASHSWKRRKLECRKGRCEVDLSGWRPHSKLTPRGWEPEKRNIYILRIDLQVSTYKTCNPQVRLAKQDRF